MAFLKGDDGLDRLSIILGGLGSLGSGDQSYLQTILGMQQMGRERKKEEGVGSALKNYFNVNNPTPQDLSVGPGSPAGSVMGTLQPSDAAKQGAQSNFMQAFGTAYPKELGSSILSSMMAPPSFEKLGPGETGFLRDRGGNITKTIPGAPAKPDIVTMGGKGLNPISLNLSDPQDMNQFNVLRRQGYSEVKAPAAVVTTNVSNTQEGQFAKTLGEETGKSAAEDLKGGDTGRSQLAQLEAFESLMTGIQTGKLTPGKATIGSWLQSAGLDPKSFGIDPTMPATAEAVTALSNKLAMSNIGPGGMPANNFSEADRKFIQAIGPQLQNTPQGNKMVIQMAKANAKRSIDKEQLLATEMNKPSFNYVKFKSQWNDYVKNTPLFPHIKTELEFSQLPSGTVFTAPDGSIKVKP